MVVNLSSTTQLNLTANHVPHIEFLWALFSERCFARDLRRMVSRKWDTEVSPGEDWKKTDELQETFANLYTNETPGRLEFLGDVDDLAVYAVVSGSGGIAVNFASENPRPKEIEATLEKLLKLYPRAETNAARSVRMKFWMKGPRGPVGIQRTIKVPSWEEILGNYSAATGDGLKDVMNGFTPSHGGQLLLWHGKPGCGKTWALRALALHWRSWCRVETVVDPEQFFGDAHYMMSVLLDNDIDDGVPSVAEADEGKAVVKPEDMWRLLILEDAGELLAEDARVRTGQGLSRMLNLADGLVGQGMKALILVTTNEPLKKLHPAVARPGRCASEVEFTPLSLAEANTWLTGRGITEKYDRREESARTIAQLYGQIEGFTGAGGAEERRAGF